MSALHELFSYSIHKLDAISSGWIFLIKTASILKKNGLGWILKFKHQRWVIQVLSFKYITTKIRRNKYDSVKLYLVEMLNFPTWLGCTINTLGKNLSPNHPIKALLSSLIVLRLVPGSGVYHTYKTLILLFLNHISVIFCSLYTPLMSGGHLPMKHCAMEK